MTNTICCAPSGSTYIVARAINDFSAEVRRMNKVKKVVFYGQEPLSGESTTTECGVNYQLLSVNTEVAQWGTPSCSRPQPAMDNGVRDGR